MALPATPASCGCRRSGRTEVDSLRIDTSTSMTLPNEGVMGRSGRQASVVLRSMNVASFRLNTSNMQH